MSNKHPHQATSVGNDSAFPVRLFCLQRLPQQVFANATGCFLFFEFGRAFSEGAWRLFSRLAREFGEHLVRVKAIEPDAHAYYQHHFGEVAEFALEGSDIESAYVARMHNWPAASIADAMAYRADVAAWGGDSGRWACWGEREFNLCVLHVVSDERLIKELRLLPDDYLPILSLEDALANIVSSEFTSDALEDFAKHMRLHYASPACT